MKNCLIEKLCGFKGDRIWRINFLLFPKFPKPSLFFSIGPYIFSTANQKNIK